MDTEGRWLRTYYWAVGLFAIWVGFWGVLLPQFVDNALPWTVPPLHARFIGAMYLSGATLMFGALQLPRLGTRLHLIPVVMATAWTGMLGVVSFLNLNEFEFWRIPVWFWFFAYVAFPLAGAWLGWRLRSIWPAAGAPVPGWIRPLALAQAAVCIALAGALFLAPATMVEAWPWPITALLAQLYSGPFLSYGIGSLLITRAHTASEVRWPLAATALFAVLVLAASVLHLSVFEAPGLPVYLWFGGFACASVWLVLASAVTWRAAG